MGTSVSVALPTDSDGFVSQECHACSKRFKAVFGEGSDRPIAIVPTVGTKNRTVGGRRSRRVISRLWPDKRSPTRCWTISLAR